MLSRRLYPTAIAIACGCMASYLGCSKQTAAPPPTARTTNSTGTAVDSGVGASPAEDLAPSAGESAADMTAHSTDAAESPDSTSTGSTETADAAETTHPTDSPVPEASVPEASVPEAAAPAEEAATTHDGLAPEGTAVPTDSAEAADAPLAAVDFETGTVLLGSPELTAGIPGEGALTMEQIEAWVNDPNNHLPLVNVILPNGLSLGQPVGLENNPLTLAKIELGRQLYFDTRLSADNTVSCASCHHPDHGYAKETRFGVGVRGQEGGRNSPVAYNRILSSLQFWDGRAASLEEQAVGPIQNPIEMANTHEQCVASLAAIPGYALQFEKVFGGEVTIEKVGQAIAAFERCLVTGPSPFDYAEQLRPFAALDLETLEEDDPDVFQAFQQAKELAAQFPMSESAQRGREIFFTDKGGCTACHVGPNLADEKYHNLGVGMDAAEPDLGRFAITGVEADKGAFKTPTIRNVALTAPYMHDGSQATLAIVVDWYAKGGHPNSWLDPKMRKLELTDQEKADLVAFMEACTGELPKMETGRLPP